MTPDQMKAFRLAMGRISQENAAALMGRTRDWWIKAETGKGCDLCYGLAAAALIRDLPPYDGAPLADKTVTIKIHGDYEIADAD